MKDFFKRKYDNKYKNSIYYLDNQKYIFCKASRTSLTFTHKISLEENGKEKYRLARSKGSGVLEFLRIAINNFRGIEFTIFNDNQENIGIVKFKNKKSIECIFKGQTYILKGHGEGYFSIKENGNQIALLKREPLAKFFYNKYCVWYEYKMNTSIDILLLLLSINDYMFYCLDWEYYIAYKYAKNEEPSQELSYKHFFDALVWPSFRKVNAPEIKWRPSDSDENTNSEDSIYLDRQTIMQKMTNKFFICLVIVIILGWALIVFCWIKWNFLFFSSIFNLL